MRRRGGAGRKSRSGPPPASRLLRGLLLATVFVPALALGWGWENGRIAFVLYREPKLIAAAVLGWALITACVWQWRQTLSATELVATLKRPPVIALTAFVSYLALTGLWVRVRENYFYELSQYVLLLSLVVVLLIWEARESALASWVRGALVASLAVTTGLGLLQAFVPLAALAPIDPQIGVGHPSVMGYKNPAALALVGQIFLLAQLVAGAKKPIARLALGALLAAELVYLVSLESRTSYAALLAATVLLIVLRLARRPSRRQMTGLLAAGVVVVSVFSTLLVSRTPALSSPRAYFATDRGTYFLNTLAMARHHPLGVGLGDWQTHYPVFREHQREMSFSEKFQVRRAHSDHVQFLGEAGWPGLALWLVFLLLLAAGTARCYLRTGRETALYTSAQVVAFVVAMATDYLMELPYNKLQLFLVAFLALAASRRVATAPAGGTVRHGRHVTLAAVGVSVAALLQIGYCGHLARKIHVAAAMQKTYLEALELRAGGSRQVESAVALRRVIAYGRQIAGLAGHTKTLHKDYLLVGHSAQLLGQRKIARAATKKALELHPYYPNGLRLMASVTEDPALARRWRQAYEHVMWQATRGFEGPYPSSEP